MTQLRNHIKTSDSTEIFQTWLCQRFSELVKYSTTMNPLLFVLKKFRKYARFPTKNPISVEIISHLLGGENMDYVCMEIEDSFQCFDYCHRDILQTIQQEKDEITFFEDRKNSTSDVLIAVTKQKRTQSRRERLIFRSAVRLTIMVEPNVGFTRHFDFKGM